MPKKILLADDSVTIQKVVELTFAEGDYEVTSVGNGRAALEKLKESRPDILLCDIIMPEVSGYEVAEFVKGNPVYSAIPVILLTGTFEPFDEEKARLSGADTFITKPFDSRMLVEKVESLLKRRLVLEDVGATAMEVLTGQGGAMTVGGEAPSLPATPALPPVFEAAPQQAPPPPAAPEPMPPAEFFAAADEPVAFASGALSPFESADSPFEPAAPAVTDSAPPPAPAPPAVMPLRIVEEPTPADLAPAEPPEPQEAFSPAEPEVEDLSSLAPPSAPVVSFESLAEPPAPAVPAAPAFGEAAQEEVSLPSGGGAFDEEPLSAETGEVTEEVSGAEDWGAAAAPPAPPLPPLPPFAESEGPEPEVESSPWSDLPSEPIAAAEGIVHDMTDQQEMVAEAHQADIVGLPVAPAAPGVPAALTESETQPEIEPEVPEEPAPAAPSAPTPVAPAVTAEQVEAIVRKVIAEMAPELVRQVAWEVIPEMAESVIKRRIQELEAQVE